MRNFLFIFSAILFSFNVLGEDIKISGTVENTEESDTIRLIIDPHFLGFDEIREKEAIGDGNFSFNVDINQPIVAKLVINRESIPLYLEPGNTIEMNFEKDSLTTAINFEGEGGKNNALYHKFFAQFGEKYDFYGMEDVMKTTMVDIFEMNIFDSYKAQTNFLKDNLDKFDHSKSFQQFIKTQVRYNYLHNLFAYPIITGNANTKKMEVTPLPRVMTEVVKSEWINVEENLISDQYRGFVDYYTVYKTSEVNDFKKFKNHSTSVESKYVYARQNLEGDVFCYFVGKYLKEYYEKVNPSTVRWLFNDLKEHDRDELYQAHLLKLCNNRMQEEDPEKEEKEIASKDSKGNKGPALMKDVDGNPVRFEDFKGKVVYVDFWASWCGPCRKQFPYAHELKNKLYENLNKKQKDKIVFLYISIDDTEAGWKAALEKLGMEGFQAHSPGGWNSKIIKQFGISGIPRYMIINKKGEFVTENAPRPSDPTIFGTLMDLIEE